MIDSVGNILHDNINRLTSSFSTGSWDTWFEILVAYASL